MTDFNEKYGKIKLLMKDKGLAGVLISRQDNFSWFTGGNNYVNMASVKGSCELLITEGDIYLLSNNIEAPRLLEEELKGLEVKSYVYEWYETNKRDKFIRTIIKDGKLGTDLKEEGKVFVGSDLFNFRTFLTEEEIEKYRILGRESAGLLEKTAREIKIGESEQEIAARIGTKLYEKGIVPVVLLVAVDERIDKYRHPLPTSKRLEREAMLVVCGRRDGLVVSATRMVHFGPLPDELRIKHRAVVNIDAVYINNTRPGREIKDILKEAIQTYDSYGFKEEWKKHHQGGLTGYNSRELKATPDVEERVMENQAFAWNPSITGTKSEDTIIVHRENNEIITETNDFPYIEIKIDNRVIKRPDILIR